MAPMQESVANVAFKGSDSNLAFKQLDLILESDS